MCLRYSSSVVAPTQCSSPRASAGLRRLEASLGRAGPDDGVQFVDEEDDLSFRRLHLLQNRLQALLEFAPELRAGDQRAHVERDHPTPLEALGHVAAGDALGEPLDDRRLADAGFADQDRVVLGATRKHLNHAADLVVAADDRVELAALGELGQVAAELLERLVGRLRVLVGDPLVAADSLQRLEQLGAAEARGFQSGAGGALFLEHREEQVFDADVIVLEALGLVLGPGEGAGETLRQVNLVGGSRLARDLGEPREDPLGRLPGCLGVAAGTLDQAAGESVLVVEERREKVLDVDPLMAATHGEPLGAAQALE